MKGILSFFKSLFTSFHFIMFVMVLVLSAVIYFYGGQLKGLKEYRFEAIFLLLSVYLGYYVILLLVLVVRKILAWRSLNKKNESNEELANYKKKVEDFLHNGVSKLKIRKKLRKLPLHLVSGSINSGKTSFIVATHTDDEIQSLDLPLGQLSTSWHLTPHGVFFECPLELPDEATQELLADVFTWIFRKPSKLGQLIDFLVIEPADDLALSDKSSLQKRCKQIVLLQQILARGSGYLYPMLLLISHLDDLHGSQAFFDRLPEFTREDAFWGEAMEPQVWGSGSSQKLAALLNKRVDDLYFRISQSPEPANLNTSEKLAWNAFPFQMHKFCERTVGFIEKIAIEAKAEKHPGFSGVFMMANSKNNQERLLHATNHPEFSECPAPVRWSKDGNQTLLVSGIHRLLASGLGYVPNPSEKVATRNTRKGFLLGAVLASVSIVMLSMTIADRREHRQFMEEFEANAQQLVSRHTEYEIDPVIRLNDFADFIDRYETLLNKRSYLSRIGLTVFDPSEASAKHWRDFIAPILTAELEDVLSSSLVASLQNKRREWNGFDDQKKSQLRTDYYDQLQAYLMMTRFSERMDPNLAAKTLAPIWHEEIEKQSQLTSNKKTLHKATQVLEFFYKNTFDVALAEHWHESIYSSELVRVSRKNLAVEATADAIYQLLIGEYKPNFEVVRLSDVIPPDYPYILRNDYKFSSLYTRDAWENHVADAINETVHRVSMDDWVLGELQTNNSYHSASAEQLEGRVRELYFRDFRKHWEAYIGAFYLPEYKALDEVYHNLKLLAGERTPLVPLYKALDYQVAAYHRSGVGERLLASSQQQLSRFSALGAFTNYFQAEEGAEFKEYQEGINRLATDLETLLAGNQVSKEALTYSSAMLAGNNKDQQLHAINLIVNRTRLSREPAAGELLQKLLMLPVRSTWKTLLNLSSEALQEEWESQVYAQYTADVKGRFPFRQGGEEVSLSSFKQFFDTNEGDLWRFYKEATGPFVTLRGGDAHHSEWLGTGLEFNQHYLQALKKARQIARATFGQGNGQVGFRYALMPEPIPGISESRFVLDDTPLIYRNEPQQWTDQQWTAGRQNSIARIQLRPLGQSYLVSTQSEGGWSLLRLLHSAQAKQVSENEYELIWPVEDGKGQQITAHYRFRSDQAGLLLNKELFDSYSLPRRIF